MDWEKMSTLILAIALAVVYLTGYSYLDGFYGFYDVPLSQLNFAIQFIAAHAFIPFKHFFGAFWSAIALLLMLVLMAIIHLTRSKALTVSGWWNSQNLILSGLLSMLIWATIVMFQAPQIGYTAARQDFQSLNRAVLEFGSGADEVNALLARIEGSSLHYLVSANETHIFVVKFPDSERRWIQHIPRESIRSFRVYQNADGLGSLR